VIAGTIFENTNKPLRDWFSRDSLHARQQEENECATNSAHNGLRQLQHGAFHVPQIRAALIEPAEKLGGIVEVDETYVGGKYAKKPKNKRTPGTGGLCTGK
jgi:hypothetical protein